MSRHDAGDVTAAGTHPAGSPGGLSASPVKPRVTQPPATVVGSDGATGGSRWVSPTALMLIRSLELRARVVVEGFWSGLHRSPYHGFSVEFTEYRQYTPGDDPRYLDWRLYARSDRFYLKKFEDETNLRCYLLVDQSRSMAYGSKDFTKADYANTLAATLAAFLYQQGDAVGLLSFDDQIREYLPARHRTGHLRHLMLQLERPAAGHGTDLASPLRRVVELVRKRGLMVLISDLWIGTGELEKQLTALAASGHEVLIFQILDPAEVDFEFDEPVVWQDVETGRELLLDPVSARNQYRERLEAHCSTLGQHCRKLGISYRRVRTDQPLELLLFDFLRERMQRGRTWQRANSGRLPP